MASSRAFSFALWTILSIQTSLAGDATVSKSYTSEVHDESILAGGPPSLRGGVGEAGKHMQKLALQSANNSVEADVDLNTASSDAVDENSDGAALQSMQSEEQSAEESDQVNEVNDDATDEQSMQSDDQSAEESDEVNEVNDGAAAEESDGDDSEEASEDEDGDEAGTSDGQVDDSGSEDETSFLQRGKYLHERALPAEGDHIDHWLRPRALGVNLPWY